MKMVEIFTFLCYNYYVFLYVMAYYDERESFVRIQKELGYVNAMNQYVELSIRITEKSIVWI